MAEKENDTSKAAVGPSVVLGLVGAVVVLLLLGAAVWGVGKIVTKIREGREEKQEEGSSEEEKVEEATGEEGEVAESEEAEGEINDGETTETSEESSEEVEEATSEEEGEESQEVGGIGVIWTANDYKDGDIKGGTYTVVWGDTLWEIAEGRYGSGYEWGKIRDANLDKVGYLPNGSRALIFSGQVLTLP